MGNRLRILSLILLLLIPVQVSGQFNRVTNIFVQELDTVTAVTITSTEKANYSTFLLDGTEEGMYQKLVVDIHGALREVSKISQTAAGPVQNVRSSQWLEEPAVVRIVTDLRIPATYRVEQQDNRLYLLFTNYTVQPEIPVVAVRTPVTRPEQQVVQQTAAVSMLNLRNQTIGQVIEAFMRLYNMNIITSKSIDRDATIDVMISEFKDPVMLFETILIANDYKYVNRDNIFLVIGRETVLEDELDYHIFKLKYLDANDIINQLRPLVSANGDIQIYSRRAMGSTALSIPSGSGGGGGGGGAGGASGGGGSSSPLQGFTDFSEAEDVQVGQERSNVLLVYETPARIAKISKVLEILDTPVPQVNIAVKIVETSLGENEKWGVNWTAIIEAVGAGGQATGSTQQGGAGTGGATASASVNAAEGTIVPGIQLKANNFRFGTISFNQFKAVMSLMESQENSKLLNQPSVTTLDGQEANIAVGKIIPIEVTQIGSSGGQQGGGGGGSTGGGGGGAAGGGAVTTIQQQEVSIALSVIPQVNENKYITLFVKPVVQEIVGFTGSNGELPITSTRTTTTQVRVKDGDVIIIGGLIKEDKLKVETRVKFLNRLPLLGRLFRHTRIETTRSELVIFITPNIIKDHAITEDTTLK